MYLAEIHGKLSSTVERKEDILTSNVFSFFKYSDRKVYLKNLMQFLEIDVTDTELEKADFIFWPNYDDYTQPDLVTVVGDNYILWEAKYFSDFGGKQDKTKSQIIREIEGGLNEAKSFGKKFYYIAITADYVRRREKFGHIPNEYLISFKWLNWQRIAFILLNLLERDRQNLPNFDFANDLYRLLDKKNLRGFLSFDRRLKGIYEVGRLEKIFFSAETAKYRGQFLGFGEALAGFHLDMPEKEIFYKSLQYRGNFLGFSNTLAGLHLNKPGERIFYRGVAYEGQLTESDNALAEPHPDKPEKNVLNQRVYFNVLKHKTSAPSGTLFYRRRV